MDSKMSPHKEIPGLCVVCGFSHTARDRTIYWQWCDNCFLEAGIKRFPATTEADRLQVVARELAAKKTKLRRAENKKNKVGKTTKEAIAHDEDSLIFNL